MIRQIPEPDVIAHTKEPWVCREQGEANEYCLLTSDGKWVIGFRQNGELLPAQQRENVRRIVACVNACANISTESLESGEQQNLVMRARLAEEQRNSLLATLRLIERVVSPESEDEFCEQAYTLAVEARLRAIAWGVAP